MSEFIVASLIGVACVLLGISNMKGNLSSLHSYHRQRVSDEDRIPFGKKIGLGTVICGCAIILYGGFSAITLYTDKPIFLLLGTAVLIAGLATGLTISIYAMIKYNKGIF